MSSILFSPLKLRGLELANRIAIAPMCQYSANDGVITDWHLMHYGQFTVSGTGALFVEATSVSPEGRISPGDVGIWSDDTAQALGRLVKFRQSYGNVPLGVQLAHAGRKASTGVPWGEHRVLGPDTGGWSVVGPSAISFSNVFPMPEELDQSGLDRIKSCFVEATHRAEQIGVEIIEIHAAHGYLLQQFLSPLSNQRSDDYGGSLENRMRYPLEIFAAVREVWPDEKPLGIRISAVDWVEGGWTLDESVTFAKALEAAGCDFIDVSSAGATPDAVIDGGPGYQVPFAAAIKAAVTDMKVMAVGLITSGRQAETILRSGQADMVALGRGFLYDPHWTWRAAEELGAQAPYPPQYARCHPSLQGLPIPPGAPPAES
ncbi:MAG: NADH:flavin oxidoreductase/NADH oxidase [Alphaproteobacteria bacterium]|jgi:2,4-dienoyl-CoA reductase-like NADH-dependent reductase (Old Yellow Enzyme family)|nr:oxidoreductase [Rhodospirillaceae bacterium]MDP6407063.1 NADH:flavin oxidoreductase/NADH oxidase [Alphaproteobacteria bacterium]MDP6623518.1 NADH:flavin oxidoreductase/NADH oxidase [Alphaproteobacteria bacterium]